ncbi:MAG: exodeoxyribonuclease VII large subunit [Marivibrio sp.]|uniref:exodeoxyribonuclease VII large subunit n=1 Tax=Marivibrio sp. TaxID=2039719 RepID=UPI0032EF176A
MSSPAASAVSNAPEFSVSELSAALKRTVEESFSYVRVRGEISGFKRAASGHLYMAMKDADAVLDAVCWRGTAGRLSIKPEDGMEVIATGRLTTYPGRSKYQIVIESLELAGEGALLKLLDDRRKKLAAEGLFAEERKRPLPFLPSVIGVVTSPTGSVIRDILHRLRDRFPRHVLIWPTAVQGDGAADAVAAAIAGFNRLTGAPGEPPRPDVLIVARGGGSLEDLWAFNEEAVVRAAAASEIPLISAVGHETDTTLIDFASDRRAPTPTAAAEIAVPVRSELMIDLADRARRLSAAAHRGVADRAKLLAGLARGLPRPHRLLEGAEQKLDDLSERFVAGLPRLIGAKERDLAQTAARLRTPLETLRGAARELDALDGRLTRALASVERTHRNRFADSRVAERLTRATTRLIEDRAARLARQAQMLESLSYERVLERGYAVVRRAEDGAVVSDADALRAGDEIDIAFRGARSRRALVAGGGAAGPPSPRAKPKARQAGGGGKTDQQELF